MVYFVVNSSVKSYLSIVNSVFVWLLMFGRLLSIIISMLVRMVFSRVRLNNLLVCVLVLKMMVY